MNDVNFNQTDGLVDNQPRVDNAEGVATPELVDGPADLGDLTEGEVISFVQTEED